ncbi:hypothetical protein [Frigidibacter sp. ROC022]|uniref:hypothetical protein n=1 Tax=Frigidibacter sp. ROC022 TaxID=2971796 RepID=UPI00215A264B|nr:hypothetical protein [Frigidibacter sp. ROC022]MCR8725299.1 hypothetical protein [Frigidibacter sp. ROC022]
MTDPLPALGHNRGPSLAPGSSWARHCWTRARAELLPTLPLEVIRLRVARAREIGLDYPTYARVRATTGRDIVAFLFSTETLRLRPVRLDLPSDRAGKLAELAADRLLLAAPDVAPEMALRRFAEQGVTLAGASPAPAALGPWAEARAALRAALDPLKLPGDAVLLIGEGRLQQDWAEAGHLAGFVPGDRFFGGAGAAT